MALVMANNCLCPIYICIYIYIYIYIYWTQTIKKVYIHIFIYLKKTFLSDSFFICRVNRNRVGAVVSLLALCGMHYTKGLWLLWNSCQHTKTSEAGARYTPLVDGHTRGLMASNGAADVGYLLLKRTIAN